MTESGTPPSAPRSIVTLGAADCDRYCDHLMRLNDEDRRFRFFQNPPEFLIALHAGAAASDGRIIVACEYDGELRGAGELLADPEQPDVGELAFSVERDWRRRGIGRALMREMIAVGRARNFTRLELEILPDNEAMQALARRFTDDFQIRNGNVFATIDLAAVTI